MADKRRILIAVLTILICVAAVIKGGSAVEAHASETTYTFSFS